MKTTVLSLVLIFYSLFQANSQDVLWLNTTPVTWSLNPEMPQQLIRTSPNSLVAGRLVNGNLSYGLAVFGDNAIDCYDLNGNLLWSYTLGSKAVVERLAVDDSGNVYAAGSYMETMYLNVTDSLVNTGSGLNVNLFLLSLNPSGNLIWKRNVTLTHINALEIGALQIDQAGQCWYALSEFSSTSVIRLGSTGLDVQTYLLQGTRSMNSFSFDPHGNLYLAGSTELGTLTVAGTSITVPESYMMFVSRINSNGNCSWIRLAHDATFQSPEVVATLNGGAFVSGDLMDSTTFGTVHFHGPQWVYDIFLTRVDSSGNFLWGVEPPITPTIVGDFHRAKNNFIDVDAAGNVYLTGTVRGSVDWGNGVITSIGPVPTQGTSILSFSNSGIARWQVTGGSSGFDTPYSVSVVAQDECFFACAVNDSATFDSITVNTGGSFALLIGKIGPVSTGVSHHSQGNPISIYPVPSTGIIYFSRPVQGAVELVNVMGSRVKMVSDVLVSSLDISGLPSGIYFLNITEGKNKFRFRVIIAGNG